MGLLLFFLITILIIVFAFVIFLIFKKRKKKFNLFGDDSFLAKFVYMPRIPFFSKRHNFRQLIQNLKKGKFFIEEGSDEKKKKEFKKRYNQYYKKILKENLKENKEKIKSFLSEDKESLPKDNKDTFLKRKEKIKKTNKNKHSKKSSSFSTLFKKGKGQGITNKRDKFKGKFYSLEELIEVIENKNMKKVLIYLKERNFRAIEKPVSKRVFKSEKELIKFIKEEIENLLKSLFQDLKDELSEIRKQGKDVLDSDLRLMQFPLKLKLFTSTYKKEDLEKVMEILDYVQNNLNSLKQNLEKTKHSKNKESI